MIVKKVHKIPYSGDVYNLEVADNHNYIADDVLVSNCHSVKSFEINNLGKKCVNAEYRIGFTGTLPKDKSDQMNIQTALGNVIFDLESNELIESGILSKIKIVNLLLQYPSHIINSCKRTIIDNKTKKEKVVWCDYKTEEKTVREYKDRMKIFNWIFNHIKDGQNSLILVSKVDHLKAIEQHILDTLDDKYKVFVVWGEIKTKQRDAIRRMLETEENCIIVATYATFSTGLNVKKLHNVIFGSSLKSEITIPQSIGRGLRTHGEKDHMVLWDIVDDMRWEGVRGGIHENYMFNHFRQRLELYTESKFQYNSLKLKIESI